MPLMPASAPSLVDQVIEALRGLLASGEWALGARIPPEPALAASLDVSRNTVREAVKALAHAGLLEVRRGDGTYVVAATEMRALMRRQADRGELEHLLEVRHAIEVRAAALAAGRRTAADLVALDEAMARREAALRSGDVDGFVAADVDFHVAVVVAAHNPLLAELYDGLVETLRASIGDPADGAGGPSGTGELDRAALGPEHRAVQAAIIAGDAPAAGSAAAELLDHVPR